MGNGTVWIAFTMGCAGLLLLARLVSITGSLAEGLKELGGARPHPSATGGAVPPLSDGTPAVAALDVPVRSGVAPEAFEPVPTTRPSTAPADARAAAHTSQRPPPPVELVDGRGGANDRGEDGEPSERSRDDGPGFGDGQ